jgi:two-component system, OmpR family, phosphate regulon sensor histidine kinase PhoR
VLKDKTNGGSRKPREIVAIDYIHSTIIKSLPAAFSLVDKDGVIVEFNPAAERMTGYASFEVIGKSHLEILHGTSNPEACPFFRHVFQNHSQTIETEGTLVRKDRRSIFFTVTSAPLFDDSGTFVGGVEIFRDITEIKRLERERRNMLSMFVHDMKNPLIVIHAYIAKLIQRKKPVEQERERYLTMALNEVTRLEKLISEFLDFSTFEDSHILNISSLNLKEILQSEVERHSTLAEDKKITIRFEYPDRPLGKVHADRPSIERVIANLIGNAIKYNKPGGVVTVKLTETDKYVLVEVSDTGIGIRKDDLPNVFDAFFRADSGVQGTGLGLAIARRIIEKHGGVITVDSVFGKGSTFKFTLPRE